MTLERRRFVLVVPAIAALFWRASADLWGSPRGQLPQRPSPPIRQIAPEGAPDRSAMAEKAILEERQNDIKKSVQRLFEIASQLKEEVEKTDSSKIFSLNLVRRAEEAAKLAKHIKSLAQG